MKMNQTIGNKISISVGICAYNEAENIGLLLQSLLTQKTTKIIISEIIVVSSGSTDSTDKVVKKFAKKDSRVKLLTQRSKEGKISAINLFLKKASSGIVVLENADTLPEKDALERLVIPFFDKRVGLSGARPIVVNSLDSFFGFANHLLWDIHHQLAREGLKISELIAFRKELVPSIPIDISGDEQYIETVIPKKGSTSKYTPLAKFRLRGPENLHEFIKQRRRCYAIQLDAKKKFGYYRPTGNKNLLKMSRIGIGLLEGKGVKFIIWVAFAAVLELVSRMLGSYDYHIAKEIYRNWQPVKTTKKAIIKPSR